MSERRQQIFAACEKMKAEGYYHIKEYTYRCIQDTCQELGFPVGNTKTMKIYRGEWLQKTFGDAPTQSVLAIDEEKPQASSLALDDAWKQQLQALREINEQQREEYQNRESKLERHISDLNKQLADVQADFYRQESLIDSLHRERSDFYKTFSVMRKQFEQLPKWQEVLQSQQGIADTLKQLQEKGEQC